VGAVTYIRDLDPQWHDPRLDTPVTCVFCGKAGTLEDFEQVWEIVNLAGERREFKALVCPWCDALFRED
jgi:hypothetical protein